MNIQIIQCNPQKSPYIKRSILRGCYILLLMELNAIPYAYASPSYQIQVLADYKREPIPDPRGSQLRMLHNLPSEADYWGEKTRVPEPIASTTTGHRV